MASTVMLGRLIASRHTHECPPNRLHGTRMLTLQVLGESGPVKAGDLAALLGVKAPAASSLIDGLVREGLVVRDADPADRRVTLVSMTEEGAAALTEAQAVAREHMRRFASALCDEDIAALIRIQRTLISTFDRPRTTEPTTSGE